jgi:hypothetical protein
MGPVFVKLREQLDEAIAHEKISEDFLVACENGVKEFSSLKDESKKYPEMMVSLKLYSATDSGEVILKNCISELKAAVGRGENPATLNELSGLISEVCDLGEEIKIAMEQNDISGRLKSIRKRTFWAQEEAEKISLIEDIDTRLSLVPERVRKTFVKYSMQR